MDRIVVGISGASGAVYGVRVLTLLQSLPVETHLVVSKAAVRTLQEETGLTLAEVTALAHHAHPAGDVGASIASGSFRTRGMIVAPCSVRSMSEIAAGTTAGLLTRAADVTLKERRPLVLMVRETPFHAGHLETMLRLTRMGAIIAPPLPAFYTRPATIEALVDQSCARALDLLGLEVPAAQRWGETIGPRTGRPDPTPSEETGP